MRDMTNSEFQRALAARGWTETGVFGYVNLGGGLSVSKLNAGDNRRRQLAYLIAQERIHGAKRAEK